MSTPRDVWVFHRGALGDSVVLWPMLRAKVGEGRRVHLVTDRSKAELAAAELGIVAVDAEQRQFNDLWLESASIAAVADAAEVIAFMGSTASDPWLNNLQRMFPAAAVDVFGTRPDARFAKHWSACPHGVPPSRVNKFGPLVLHIGAGSNAKRWPLDRFIALGEQLAAEHAAPAQLIAGEVEAERFASAEREAFSARGGRLLDTLAALASVLRSASLVIGCDSGPSHLAAQLGVPVLALFGPTDPDQWAPVGPLAHHLAPAAPQDMNWLPVETAAAAASELIHHAHNPGVSRIAASP
jgi:heptosyltransferase III